MRRKYQVISITLLGILAGLLSGCGNTKAYAGSARSSDDVAVVRAWGATLHSVNGVAIGAFSTGAVVMPGKNEVKFSVNASNFNSPGIDDSVYSLELNAEPGKEYAITGKRGIGKVCAYEIIPETGQPDYGAPAGCMTR